jgi:phosphatidylinositol alpha 1,6-mannosyltransferase
MRVAIVSESFLPTLNFVSMLAGDDAMRMRMGEAGRRSVLDRSWDSICAELIGHHSSAIAHRTRALAVR